MDVEREALDDLILGRGVKRGRHLLEDGVLPLFMERLAALGFCPLRVSEIGIDVGSRVPAWHVAGITLDFGTVFWEVFTDRAKRKLFASEVRNTKGDWDIQLGTSSQVEVYTNLGLSERYDISRPVGMY